jgi:hypothetical protein
MPPSRRASRWQNARPANRLAGPKTASRKFFSRPSILRPELLPQVTETHQESLTYVFVFVSGCVVAPNSAGGSALGSRLRSVPLVGGMLGAVADIASGEVKYGVNSLSTILAADLKAKLVGVYGHEVAKKNAFDKFVADPTLENIKNLALTTMIPSYGNFGGRGWGVDQGRDLSKILNFVDFNSALHDQEYGNLEFPDANKSWVYRNYSSVPSDQIAPGPFGVTYVLEGTAPFLLFK